MEELMDMASKKPELIPVEEDDEVTVMPSPPEATAPSAGTSSPPVGPIGDDGLTANQRIVLQVFCDDQCMDSPNGFSADDVINFLMWRDGPSLTSDQVVEAMEFLSSDARIGITNDEEHYCII